MRLAVFYVWGSLLAFSVCDICPETSEDAASWVKLKPLGHCRDEDNLCPYRLTLPPLSIQLPRPFRELEKMAKELQNLKQVVNQLRRDCQECKDRHSLERGERTDHIEKEERGPQNPRHSIGISHSGEQDVQIHTSTLLQGDRSESEGAIKGGMKSLNYPILEGEEWNIDPTIDLNEGTTDQRSEMSREVKIFNPSLDELPEGISKITPVPTPVGKEWELKSKRSELIEPSLPRKKDEVHSATPRKQLPDILRDGRVKNISGILTVRRVQNVPDPNRLSSTLRNANMQTMDLSTSAVNRKVVKPSGTGGTLRPKGSYINNRAVKVNKEDRLRNPALVRNTNPQDGDITVKIEPEEAGFSPARSGVMRVKETSPRMANTKPGTISGSTPSKDDQNKQDISRDSGSKTDDGQTLKDASQATIIRENNLRNINKTDIAKLPTTLKQEKESDMTHTDSNKSVPNIVNQAEQENMDKEEKKHTGLSESLVVISSEAETITNTDREDMPFSGRQVENEKYLNPITETNNGQIGSKVLDKADSNLNSRTVNPVSPDLKDKTQPETFTEGGNEETGFNSLNSETEKNIPSHSKASLSEKDLVQPTIVPTVKGRLISTVRSTSRVKSPVTGHGIIRTSKTPLKIEAEFSQNSNKDIGKIREVSQEIRYVMPGTTVISPKGPKMGQFNMTNKIPSKLPIPFRNGNTARTNVSGIVKPYYTRRKPNFQTEANTNRGIKTKVSTVTQFFSPTGATTKSSTVEQEQTEEIEQIPQMIRSHLLDNHRLKNITEIKSQPESQNVGDVRDLNKFQEENNRAGFNSEGVLISNTENSAEDPITMQSETSNSPTSERERKIFSLGTADINSQHPSELDKISNWKKRPTAPTLKKELQKEPRTNRFTTSTVSFTDTENEDSTKNIRTVTNTTKNNSQDAQKGIENISATPNKRSNALHNRWLRNNSTESKPRPQNLGNADLDKVQKGKNQTGDDSKTVLISNIENGAEDPNTLQSGESNLPTGGKENKMPILATVESSSQVEVDKISSGKKRPTAPTLKKELSKKPGTTQFTTSTVSFTDTDLEGSTKAIHSMTNTHAEMAKNVNQDTPISYENIGATRELELIKLNKDRVEENPGEVLSNPNSGNMDQGYREERYTIPVVLETLTNVEEIKGSKLFSLSPEDTAEGFKSHSVSDEVTQREQAENEIHSTCLGDCNTTPTQHSQSSSAQTRTPFVSGREKGPAQDCADYMSKSRRNGVYRVTPRPKNSTFPVFCDMESSGGGWTLIQHRFDGSTSFNRTWDEYKNGFGKLIGEFWLGNDKIHFLTKAKNMSLRIEIEDFEGNREYAHYDHFYVANETQQYRLSIGGYSGTAGDAMQFSNKYNHDQKLFTTPDRDNDHYPSGNCGAYYSSGWWFDACMSANLNGRYYQSKYKGVRNGIFWGTWHNITMEYYPTNDRQSFKTVRMMIRPKNYTN